MKKAWDFFFQNDTIFTISSKKYHFKKIFLLAFFQYSDRTVASTERNDTSAESSDTKLFANGKSEGVALLGGLHAHLPQKDIETKVNLTELSQETKQN